MPTPSRELHYFGNYCIAAVSTNNALVALKCLKHPRVDCGVSLSVQFLVKNKVITLGDLTEVPQAFTWNNKVIFPVFRYSPGVQCCPHLFWLLQIHFTYDFPYLCDFISLSITLCLQDLLQNHLFWWFSETATLTGLRASPDRSKATTGVPWQFHLLKGRENLAGIITSKPVESDRRPFTTGIWSTRKDVLRFHMYRNQAFSFSLNEICVWLKEKIKEERTKCNFPWDTAQCPAWFSCAIFWLVHKMVVFGIKKGNSDILV